MKARVRTFAFALAVAILSGSTLLSACSTGATSPAVDPADARSEPKSSTDGSNDGSGDEGHTSTGNPDDGGSTAAHPDGGLCHKQSPEPLPVDDSKQVTSFSSSDRDALCAWAEKLYGGYDCSKDCGSGFEGHFYDDLATCRANLTRPGCQASSSDVAACFAKDAEDVCAFALFDAPECAAWKQCLEL